MIQTKTGTSCPQKTKRLLSIPEMDIRGKKKDYPSINDYYKAASRGKKPIQYQHGLSNFSSVQLGDERISFKKSLSQDVYRLDIEEPEKLRDAPVKSFKERREEYDEANEVVGLNKIHEMEQMMRDKLQQRTKTGPFQLRKTFKYFDRDGSGGIDFDEFQRAMELMGFAFTEIQQLALFARYDESCNGEVDYNDFVEKVMESDFKAVKGVLPLRKNAAIDKMLSSAFATSKHWSEKGVLSGGDDDDASDSGDEEVESFRRREVKKMFDVIDKDGSGYIDYKEMQVLLRGLGRKYDREEINQGFSSLDSNYSGHIEFEEFYKWYKRS